MARQKKNGKQSMPANKSDGKQHKRWVDKDGNDRRAIKKLSQKEFMVVEYYLQGFTKKDSMLKAGYSETYARDRMTDFFANPRIDKAIDERRWAMKTRSNKIVDRIQDELAKIAFFNIGHFICTTDDGDLLFDYSDATMDQLAAVGEITIDTYVEGRGEDAETVKRIKCKPYDKKAALDSLARIHGMFNDKLEVSEGESLEARLQRGRMRANKIAAPDVIDAEYEDVTDTAAE